MKLHKQDGGLRVEIERDEDWTAAVQGVAGSGVKTIVVQPGAALLRFQSKSGFLRMECRECGAASTMPTGPGLRETTMVHEAGCEVGDLLRILDEATHYGRRLSRRERVRLSAQYEALVARYSTSGPGGQA